MNVPSKSFSRAKPETLSPFARELYSIGLSREDVLRKIYAVDFPEEFYLIESQRIAGNLDLTVEYLQHPWDLIATVESGGPSEKVELWSKNQEKQAFQKNPQVIPLMQLSIEGSMYDDYIIGYERSELAQGRSTVVGHKGDITEKESQFVRIGASVLSVLETCLLEKHRILETQYNSLSNRGMGSVREEDVHEVKEDIEAIATIRSILRNK